MYKVLSIFVVLLTGFSVSSAQSGRRVTPTPSAESAVVKKDDPAEYSESKPRSSRTSQPVERFPGIGLGSNKKSAPAPAAIPIAGETQDDGETLRVETNLVTIPVSVFDRNGLYIPGLRRTDFKIFEDGLEQEIAYFGTSDKPFTVVLVIDVSPSTAFRIEDIRNAAKAFVDQLQAQDSVAVIDFDHNVRVTTEATRDRMRIFKAIDKADFGNGTSLYNAVDEALRKQLSKIEGRKAVVLFTDGVDTTSRKNNYDSTLNYAEEADTLIFPIYYNTYLDNKRANGGLGGGGIFGGGAAIYGAGITAEEYAVGRRYLDELSDATGGRVFRPESTPGGLTAAFEGIAEELRRQYNIGFVPSEESKAGQRKNIRVRVNRPNLVIRARDSYVVGASTAPPKLTDNSKK